jgi:hypothetical protein
VVAILALRLGFELPSVSELELLRLSASSAWGGLPRLTASGNVGFVEGGVDVSFVEGGVFDEELLKIFLPGFNECVNRGR